MVGIVSIPLEAESSMRAVQITEGAGAGGTTGADCIGVEYSVCAGSCEIWKFLQKTAKAGQSE